MGGDSSGSAAQQAAQHYTRPWVQGKGMGKGKGKGFFIIKTAKFVASYTTDASQHTTC